ncbi:hypothetical protein FHS18_005414 [Paenibacillus phyllosphaerae]|uniref:Heparinase II/III-like C-terminal domain-containing protein n=1 Tax=Paenibacillus phyllosphaerae TaxID=274593 RepID=A0A7W5B2L0_9BACL|nr:heparinase II/III family protein [Paenibacillus phyllosphaerae]MBB3113302.1 hypothetical protein [Paenibacillus phyllosphaerae]
MIAFRQLRDAILAVQVRPSGIAGGELFPTRRRELQEDSSLQGLLREIRIEANRAVQEPIPPLSFAAFQSIHVTGSRKDYEQPYFDRRGRLLALTLATVLDDTDVYIEALENLVWEICGEYAWAVPAHLPSDSGARDAGLSPDRVVDLFAAETAHALAEMLYFIGDRLHVQVTDRVRAEIERRVFQPAFERASRFHWSSKTNNWSAVCAGAAGMAALLLIDDRERLAGIQHLVASAMDSFLEGYGEDGCCIEGLSYWRYGFGYYVYWAEMLYEFTGGTVDQLASDKIKRIAEFPSAVMLSGGLCVNYSDCRPYVALPTGLISRLIRRIGIAPPEMAGGMSFHDDHCYRWPHVVRNLLWTQRNDSHAGNREGSFYFPSADWLVVKRATPNGLIAFSAKGGHNGEPHNHNDLGHFILHAAGESLLADLGMGVYTRDYFGPERYSLLQPSSAGHSVPVINGCLQQAGEHHRAVVTAYESQEGTVRFELDVTQAYDKEAGIRSFRRTFDWRGGHDDATGVLILTDRFVFEPAADVGERRISEHFISWHPPELGSGTICWQGERGAVILRFDPSALSASVEELKITSDSIQGETVYRLALHAANLPETYTCRLELACKL